MKKACFTIFILSLILVQSCQKFEPATCVLNIETPNDSVSIKCSADITDNGGCIYFIEQGYCLSFYHTPSTTDKNSTIEKINTGVRDNTFSWDLELTEADTTYYIRAFVKTNAGTGYSNIISVRTP